MAAGGSALPVAEDAEQRGPSLGADVLGREPADELDRRSHLLHVRGASATRLQMRLEAGALLGRERTLEVVGHELDELLATQPLNSFHHRSSERYSSSARLTLERARCRST